MYSTINLQTAKWYATALLPLMLSGCIGGTATRQLAMPAPIPGTDKANVMASNAQGHSQTSAFQNIPLKDIASDKYQMAFVRSGFEKIQPPIQIQVDPTVPETETPAQLMQESKLVNVEVWNLLIGDEKQQLLEQAREQGSNVIPPQEEWPQWQIAVGAAENQQSTDKKQAITFLIPPEIGKMRSGAIALVELPGAGELGIARYLMN